jgi:glucan phosphorylase
MYYDYPARWLSMVQTSMQDIKPYFDSNRMAAEYYDKMYSLKCRPKEALNKHDNSTIFSTTS